VAHSDHDQVVEVTLFALGMLAGAALASIDRLRHRQRQYRQPGRRIAMPADPQGRAIERKLRAAAARRPADEPGPADERDEPSPDYPVPGDRPQWPDRPEWPDLPEPVDLRGPAGNRLPPGGLEPFDVAEAFSYSRAPGTGEYDDEDYADQDYGQDEYESTASAPVESAPAESASVGASPATLRDALRELSEGIAVGGEPLPPIVGIHLTTDALDVLLSAPAATPPPAPFTIAPARQAMCWTVSLGTHGGGAVVPPVPGEVGDLLPGLFTAGATDAGGYLLLDLEAMRVTCCDGPADLTDRLLVTAATELASSHWSGWYDLVLAGCDELEVLGRAELCSTLDEAIDVLETRTRAVARRLDDHGPADVRTRRLADPDDEDWGLTLLVSRLRPTPAQMGRLLALADGPGGIAALVAGDTQTEDGKLAPALFQLGPEPDPREGHDIVATITLAYLGPQHQITVWPQTLTMPEYQALAGVFATAADLADVPLQAAPYSDFGEAPWIRLAAAPVAPDDAPPVGADWPEPGLAEPRYSDPRHSDPRHSDPRHSDPRHSDPRYSEPGLAEPRYSDPRHSDPRQSDPRQSDPRQSDPRQSDPRQSDPRPSEPRPSEPRFEPDRLDQLLSHVGYLEPDDPAHAQPSPPFESLPPHPPVPPYQPAHGHRSGSAPKSVSSSRPRHAAPSLRINVLGPVQITGAEQPLEPKQAELLLALALHAPVGVSNSGLAGLLGTDADHPRPADSVRQLITKTRKRLGQAPDGQEYIIHLGSGIYVPHGDLTLDWASFSALARRGLADRYLEDLRAAMALVRGEPFADCYHWWIDVSLIETMRAEIIDTAELLSQLELAAGDPQAAARAAKAGLAAEPAAEQLWRALMRAESQAGNLDGVAAAWTGCLDAIEEIAPGGEPHPDTEHLYRQLANPAPLPSRR
jgi:DNA-binding SARP family transcriptional activator